MYNKYFKFNYTNVEIQNVYYAEYCVHIILSNVNIIMNNDNNYNEKRLFPVMKYTIS